MYKKLSTKMAARISKFFSWYAHKFHNKHGMYVCYDPVYWYNKDSSVRQHIKPIPVYLYIGKASYERDNVYCELRGLQWKDKYDSPRHEENPLFVLKFFRLKMQLEWTTNDCLKDVIYWETILDIVYYGKTMREAIDSNTWDDLHNKKTNLETLGYFH